MPQNRSVMIELDSKPFESLRIFFDMSVPPKLQTQSALPYVVPRPQASLHSGST